MGGLSCFRPCTRYCALVVPGGKKAPPKPPSRATPKAPAWAACVETAVAHRSVVDAPRRRGLGQNARHMEASDDAAPAANGGQELPEDPVDRVRTLIERVVETMGVDGRVEVECIAWVP